MEAIRAVNILKMMETLKILHDMGVDYVDIHGEQGEEEDTVVFGFNKKYMNPEHVELFENINGMFKKPDEPQVKIKFDDKNIGDII